MKKTGWMLAVLILLIALGILTTLTKLDESSQARSPILMPLSFEGEYSIGGSPWQELTPGSDLPASAGDLRLKGHFDVDYAMNETLFLYLDHVDVILSINGEESINTFKPTKQIAEDFCGTYWYERKLSGITREDEVEILLHSAHKVGNGDAYNQFLERIHHGPKEFLRKCIAQEGNVYRITALTMAVFSLIVLGFALGFSLIRIPLGTRLAMFGLSSLLMSGYIALDTTDVYFWSEMILLNTMAEYLCRMLAALGFGFFVSEILAKGERSASQVALVLLALLDCTLILLSAVGVIRICSTMLPWMIAQIIVCAILIVCLLRTLRASVKNEERFIPFTCTLMLALMMIDLVGSLMGWTHGGMFSKSGFVVMMGVFLVVTISMTPEHYRDSIRAKKLEGELEESRIAVLVSQIHPHFLFNALSTIRHLCRTQPNQAWEALGDFSAYLRANTDALTSTKLIPFSQELRHIQSYLKLEKLRFGDRLNIVYDLEEEDFLLPPLTVQPLVENAVKHGIFYAKDGGTVRIATSRKGGTIQIVISDDGVGFDMNGKVQPNDRVHVGLSNVQLRLGKMINAQMHVESRKDEGTTVTIDIG